MRSSFFIAVLILLVACGGSNSDTTPPTPINHSVARLWNEVLLTAVREDFARPTVHARNLFHFSAAMYDAWALFDNSANPYLLGQTLSDGFSCDVDTLTNTADIEQARIEAISFAAYRIIEQRFANSPGVEIIMTTAGQLMTDLQLDSNNLSRDYQQGSAAALGNTIADCYLAWGLVDGANEQNDYANQSYQPINRALNPELLGNPNIENLDRWQPLAIDDFVDQSGNPIKTAPEEIANSVELISPISLTGSPPATSKNTR